LIPPKRVETEGSFNQVPFGMPDGWFKRFSLYCGCLLSLALRGASGGDSVSFNQQVQPILSEYCYPCHGPDSATRKPKKHPMRLDREQFAFEPRDGGKPVIVKGDPAASEVIRRMKATDDDQMPPPSEHKTVKAEEIKLIEKWITQGARYEKHWSLIPPVKPAVPEQVEGWGKNPIDAFVARKLKENGLKPNAEEQKARLFRRLSFDLTGLPPSPQEIRAFIGNNSEKAYESAVDKMLGSDASAEHFTRLWLDAVRYADTQGIHHDHVRSIWPYRDWVLAAFKSNMPFDRFTVEQIAGDLLPGATMEQKIASGYNRLLPTTGEGGAIPEEYEAIYAKDRVETTSAVWLGLTTGCATCHDHKFDPITTRDFYSMTAFFRNNTMPALDRGNDANVAPLLFVPAKGDGPRWSELEQQLREKQKAIDERKKFAEPQFAEWLKSADELAASLTPTLEIRLNETNGVFHGTAPGKTLTWKGDPDRRDGPFGSAPKLTGDVVENATVPLRRDSKVSYGAFILVEDKPSGAVFSQMDQGHGYRGWDLFLSEGRPTVHVIDQWPDEALKVTAKETLKAGVWHHVMAVFDGTRKGADAIKVYVNGREAEVEVNNNKLGSNIVTSVPFRLGGRSNNTNAVDTLQGGKVFAQDVRVYERALMGKEVAQLAVSGLARTYLALAEKHRTAEQMKPLYDVFITYFDAPAAQLQQELTRLKAEQERLRMRGATTLIMEEKADSKPAAHILIRGSYSNKGEKVGAAIPQALPPMSADWPTNRLGLARWIMSRENPLTARVTVNRIWAHLFGVGIVETTEDFGIKGSRPSNQELLDWLAVEFMDSGWDFRKVVRTMVTSATYRQAETISAEKLEKDPANRLYSRAPHIRLDAEQIRDQALAASGLLVKKVGGPPVKPYQPEGVWEAVAMKDSNTRVYKQDKGERLYRRSLYTFWKRTAPPPTLEILNAPSREVFCTRRDRTDTPLQAFVTMNDPQFIEAARELAAHSLKVNKAFDARLDFITENLLARGLEKSEREQVRKLQQKAAAAYHADAEAAKALITVGETPAPTDVEPAELASWTLVASEIMNLDECLTK
jgi:hypothetical protein